MENFRYSKQYIWSSNDKTLFKSTVPILPIFMCLSYYNTLKKETSFHLMRAVEITD